MFDNNAVLKELLSYVENYRGELNELSRKVWANPELAYKERIACDTQMALLNAQGFKVQSPAYGLDTAYVTEFGSGSPVFAIASEYDALPVVGHGCGHNLICTASVAAFLALRDFAKAHNVKGKFILLGTPAEESGGGKVKMLEKNCLDGVDAVMMLHPTWRTTPDTGSTASRRFDVEFQGISAHAAGSPELGVNALDAVTLLFAGVNAFRQQMPEFTRIHGIILEGGKAPNIIPDHCSCRFFVRSANEEWEDKLVERFKNIVKGAALMTGCDYKINNYSIPYKSRKPNAPMNTAYLVSADAVGLNPVIPDKPGRGSSDFGDFSHKVPGIHAYFDIAGREIPGHSIEMAQAAASEYGFNNALKGAAAMASVAAKFMLCEDFRKQVADDFKKD